MKRVGSLLLGLGLSACASRSGIMTPDQRPLAERGSVSPQCLAGYEQLFADDVLDVRVAFGYKDARPARFVGDRYERVAFVEHLVQPCAASETLACGFARARDDADLFVRTIPGPDGKPRRVELRVTHSSVGPDDLDNRINGFQRWQSRHSQTNYLQGLRAADVVFYNGHSRAGGGPDFTPPRLKIDDHVDYAWYLQHRPGLKRSLSALSGQAQTPKALGLFSCVSGKHFSKALNETAPDMALITSRKLLYYADAMASSLGALDAMLGMACEKAFEAAIQARPDSQDSMLEGFFPSKVPQPGPRPASDLWTAR